MKRLKKFVSLLTAVAICALLPGANVLTVSAAEPVTYHVKYVEEEGEWRFQIGSWKDDKEHRELYYMYNDFKDGDIVVADSNDAINTEPLAFTKHISNLTVIEKSQVVISAPSYGEVHAIQESSIAVTGDVNAGYIYDNAAITFHNNVNKLNLIDTKGESTGAATVGGTTGHVVRQTSSGYVYFEAFNVAAGQLVVEWGELKTDASQYSKTPVATQTPAAPAVTPQKPAASGEYDDVPKTGENSNVGALVAIALLCISSALLLKNKKK